MSHSTHELEPRIAASRILGNNIATVVSVVKANPVQFYLLLMQNGLVARGEIDPMDSTRREQNAVKLYQVCMDMMEIDSVKFPVMMDILSQYPLLVGAVKKMKEEGYHFCGYFHSFYYKLEVTNHTMIIFFMSRPNDVASFSLSHGV